MIFGFDRGVKDNGLLLDLPREGFVNYKNPIFGDKLSCSWTSTPIKIIIRHKMGGSVDATMG